MRQFFASMSRGSRLAFLLGLLLIAGMIGGVVWWVMHPPYGVLYNELRMQEAAEVTSTLGQMQVPYRLSDQGKTVLVPADQVYDTRMKLAAQGVPKGGSVGFELFKDSDYGVTEFAQRVNYQRALQGELERTITSLDEVASARVHLTIRRADLFDRDKQASKASVTLTLRPQKHLDAHEVAGIQRLVASAVDGLSPAAVVVLDDNGMVLSVSGVDGQDAWLATDRLDAETRIGNQLQARVSALLRHVLPTGDFTVSVDVRLDYDRVKEVSEHLIAQGKDGNGLLVREKVDSSGHAASGGDADHPGTGSLSSSDRELEYAHGREQKEIEQAPGGIKRISVGIVIPSGLPPGKVEQLSAVVSAALGLDRTRGDTVDIAAIAPSAHLIASTTTETTKPVPATVSPGSGSAMSVTPATPTVAKGWPWQFGLAMAILVVLALLLAIPRLMRRSAPRRLSAPDREEALKRLRQWLEITEVER